MQIKRYLLFCFIVLTSVGLKGNTPHDIWTQANEAYQRSEYIHAIELYENLLKLDIVSAELYYNLGNAYFRNNNIGRAVLNYERAIRLDPANDNIRHNLSIANNRTIDNVVPRPELFYERWWRSLIMMQSANAWGAFSIILLSLFLIFVATYLFARTIGIKKSAFYISGVLLVFTVLSIVFAQTQYNSIINQNEAIIMVPRVAVKSSPSAQSPDLFLIHEGTKVFLRTSHDGWYEVNLADGNIGWVKGDSFEVI